MQPDKGPANKLLRWHGFLQQHQFTMPVPNSPTSSGRWALLVLGIVAASVAIPWLTKPSAVDNRLVVYCAHDAIFADEVIRRFEQLTSIQVDVRYDEEANKSLGLTNLLIAEKDQPRCDVFWNNQTLGTIRLKEQGVLARYVGTEHNRISGAFKDAEGYWAGFAARMRVYIINNDALPAAIDEAADLQMVETLLQADSLQNMAIAMPLYGTTLSHYSVLAASQGMEHLKQWHASLHQRGIREARGNGGVKDLVAEGACDAGFTDTDDAFVAIKQGKPVRMIPVRLPAAIDGVRNTIVLPNSVALINGARHEQNARRFIDFLLSEETERLLANSASHQIPLGAIDPGKLPEEVQRLQVWAKDGIPLHDAARQNPAVLEWLSSEYLQQ